MITLHATLIYRALLGNHLLFPLSGADHGRCANRGVSVSGMSIVYILWVVDVYIVEQDLGLGFGEWLRTPVHQNG